MAVTAQRHPTLLVSGDYSDPKRYQSFPREPRLSTVTPHPGPVTHLSPTSSALHPITLHDSHTAHLMQRQARKGPLVVD